MVNVLIGVIVWQIIVWLFYLIVEKDETCTTIFSMGIISFSKYICRIIGNKISLLYDKRYNNYWMYSNSQPIKQIYMTPEFAKQFETSPKAKYNMQLIEWGQSFTKPIDRTRILTEKLLPQDITQKELIKYYKK